MSFKSEPKYRPVLTESMLKECYTCCPHGSETKEYLRKFLLRINIGMTTPGYIPTPAHSKATVFNSLGFAEPEFPKLKLYADWEPEKLYARYLQDPLSINVEEHEIVQTYRFENDLMSSEEEAEFQKKLFLS